MALKNTLMIGALLFSLVSTGVTNGQVDTPSPKFRHKAVESVDSTRPFATPGVFDYDAQMFAPLEFTNGKEKAPTSGFFFAIDKTYTSVSRAAQIGATSNTIKTGSDYIWGTRYDLGWFSDDDDGWGIAYQNAEGSYFTAGQDILVANPMMVRMHVSTVEVNRLFRQTLSKGGYFEPYIGVRYMNISDNTIEDTVQTVGVTTTGNRFKQNTTNDAFGFQAGGRYNSRRGRWRLTGDGALATTYNQQRYFATDITSSANAQGISETYQSDQAFVPIIDGQLEVAYNISRDISLRTGLQVTYAWNGIARANTLTTNINPNSIFGAGGGPTGLFDDSHLSAGFLFGVEWKR
ncbi:MAG: hypothetical protein ACI87E_000291 [Mariniblastus sp.]|jgi:hypothetical protein